MESKRTRTLRTRSPQSKGGDIKVLKSTSNLSSDSSPSSGQPGKWKEEPEDQAMENSVSVESLNNNNNNSNNSGFLINTKTPQISYRVLNLNSANSSMLTSQTSGSSNQYLLMMPNNTATFKKETPQNFTKTVIEQKRRIMHKEIERRRRDKINDWITTLAKEVPDCSSDRTKQGQSKGGILAKAVNYIRELRTENRNLAREKDELADELLHMKRVLADTEEANNQLRSSMALLEFNKHS